MDAHESFISKITLLCHLVGRQLSTNYVVLNSH